MRGILQEGRPRVGGFPFRIKFEKDCASPIFFLASRAIMVPEINDAGVICFKKTDNRDKIGVRISKNQSRVREKEKK